MLRLSKTCFRVRLLSVLTAAALCLGPALAARAASYVYGSHQRTVNAGVLISGKAGASLANAPDPSPYVFYLFNLRTDIKPFGWNVVNPQAPSAVGAATQSRWSAYAVGQAVHPDMAAYWEVPLSDTSADQLSQYNILYLPLGGSLGPAENEKLRRFVDGGGQLWVEADPNTAASGTTSYTAGSFGPFFEVGIASSNAAVAPSLPASGTALLRHALLCQPFLMSYQDLFGLGVSPDYTLSGSLGLYGNALLAGAGGASSVAVSQYGSGQIIASALDVGGAINDYAGAATTSGYTFQYNNGPFCGFPGNAPASNSATGFINTTAAPTSALRFLANVIALSGSHPSENKTGRQNAASSDFASFAPAWTYGVTPPAANAPGPPPGAAVWGNYVYVTTYGTVGGQATGVLHAFDAYPAEFLTAIGQADDGLIKDFSGSPPTAYDEVWNAPVGPNASAPTVASSGGSTSVLVEKADGSVLQFDAVTGAAGATFALPPALSASGTAGTITPYPNVGVTNAPAPVAYAGRVFAGQPDSDLVVWNADGTNGLRAPINPNAPPTNSGGTAEAVSASPSIGVLADGTLTNDIVAIVPTTQSVYTVFLGARADSLQPVGNPVTGFNVNRGRLHLYTLKIQAAGHAGLYTYKGASVPATANIYPPGPDFTLTLTGAAPGAAYDDYDADLLNSFMTTGGSGLYNGQTLNLNNISDFSLGASRSGSPPPTPNTVSAPATDRSGDLYYVVNTGGGSNSYLFGVHQDAQFRNVQIKFRFRMPTAALTDADGVDYTSLVGFQFVGAPVVDDQGLIYVAAKNGNGTSAAVLCFSATQPIYADAGGVDPSLASYSQIDESDSQPNTLQAGPADNSSLLKYGQYSAAGSRVTFYNFGLNSGQSTLAGLQLAGNLSEPQPVLETPIPDPNQTQQSSATLSLHTNLQWYTAFPVNGGISGLTKVGDTLFLSDSGTTAAPVIASILYSINANGGSDGTPITSKQIAPTAINSAKRPMVASYATLGLGPTTATPSAGTGVLVVNGTNGVAALTQQLTLVADNNRILEVDSSGNAVWGVDSTAQAGQGGATQVDFNHPTSLSQLAANDYLVADTGNNRCVRFDRAGDVIWELTRFTDPSGLLAAGQPLTLNQPTSVQVLRSLDGTRIHYLIADSGNHRVLELTDTVNTATGAVTSSHVLTWASHTGDKFGRQYRYASATYFNVSPTTGLPASVVAAVTDTRLAPPGANGALGPASADAPGGSLVGFDYASGQLSFASAGVGKVTGIYTSFQVAGTPNNTTYQVRNPRYLSVYTPPTLPPAGQPPFSLLYADDNGAFDLTPSATGFIANGLAFTQSDYEDMTKGTATANFFRPLPVDAAGDVPLRAKDTMVTPNIPGIPFVPSCVQRIGIDANGLPRYLITQTNGQSELGNGAARVGGEVFEADYDSVDLKYRGAGGFIGSTLFPNTTLSRPGLTGPLTQPTFAIRPQQ